MSGLKSLYIDSRTKKIKVNCSKAYLSKDNLKPNVSCKKTAMTLKRQENSHGPLRNKYFIISRLTRIVMSHQIVHT